MARSCLFCGERPNSREHVWPQWLLALGESHYPIAGWRDSPVFIRGPNAQVTTKQVCKVRCNTGWMAALESRAKLALLPLIQDGRREISRDDQQLITQWAVKTIMVFEHLQPKHRPRYYTGAERKALMDHLTIPGNTIAWLGRYTGDWSLWTGGVEMGPQGDDRVAGIVYTLTMGRLAIQVMSLRTYDHRPVRVRVNPGPWPVSLIQVWPTTSPTWWPPPVNFADTGRFTLRRLYARFNRTGIVMPDYF